VLRTALQPRWLALLVVVLVAAIAMALLGRWQLDRAREHGKEPVERAQRAQARAVPKPIGQVIAPQQTFPKDAVNTRVTATGRWDGAHRLLITGRTLNGRTGFWVLVPLRLADGSAVPVVRGWVASVSDPAAAAPSGDATVVGFLQPSEPPVSLAPGASTGLPADQLSRISAPDLVNAWHYPLISGFVVQQSQTPATAPAPAVVPPPSAAGGLDLLNVFYALQWWLFALVGLLFWGRVVRDDHLGRLGALRPEAPDDVSSLVSKVGDPT
jgi:cytochrome oxidase assembly protein ShyY1